MIDLVKDFCESIHGKLSTLESRMEVLKSNVGPSWNLLQEKLDEVRDRIESNRASVARARLDLAEWNQRNHARRASGEWQQEEASELSVRAIEAEDCAKIAILIAESSCDDVERMVLEAIAAGLEAEALAASY